MAEQIEISVQKITRTVVAGHLSYLTRLYNETEKLMISAENKTTVQKNYDAILAAFENYSRTYIDYASTLESQEKIDEEQKKFEENKINFLEMKNHINEWIGKFQVAEARPSSIISNRSSVSSERKLKEAQIKQEIAKLKMAQLKEIHQVKSEKLEQKVKSEKLEQKEETLRAKNELDEAQLEAKLWQQTVDDENGTSQLASYAVKSSRTDALKTESLFPPTFRNGAPQQLVVSSDSITCYPTSLEEAPTNTYSSAAVTSVKETATARLAIHTLMPLTSIAAASSAGFTSTSAISRSSLPELTARPGVRASVPKPNILPFTHPTVDFEAVPRPIAPVMTPRIIPPAYSAATMHHLDTESNALLAGITSSTAANFTVAPPTAVNLTCRDALENSCEATNHPFINPSTTVTSYLAPTLPPPALQSGTTSQDVAAAVSLAMVMPRPEILKFDGDPKEYQQFIHNFQSNIENNVASTKLRLTYLIQQCGGAARDSIKDCVVLPPESGYKKAQEILKNRFGQPHVIARAHIKTLTEGGQVRSPTQLADFATQLIRSELVLSQLSYVADLNNSENLLKVVRKLPNYLRGRWVDIADRILMTGREPNFTDLAKFC